MPQQLRYEDYKKCVSALLDSETVRAMRQYKHHFSVTCYEHSVFVSYVSFLMARKLGLDYMAAARGGLLHDLYLYDPSDASAHPGNQCLDHPVFALRNAKQLCGDLSPKEENIIIAHMWPLSKKMPHSREAFVVSMADKFCATVEVLHFYHMMRKHNKLLITA